MEHCIRISMGGKDCEMGIMVERLWRSVKYVEVYTKEYLSVTELIQGVNECFCFLTTNGFIRALAIKRDLR
jgi:putative transposase